MPTISVENYLKAIYHLQQECDGGVRTKAIASHLEISLASVTQMLKSLSEDGLAHYAPYKGARLTTKGETQALKTIRNHRLIELFLMKTLGFEWDEVHPEAEALEHALSDRVTDRIDAYLGYPTSDPHGDPIPGQDGKLQATAYPALSELEEGAAFAVRRVLDQRPEVLRYLAEQGIRPGTAGRLLRREPFDGPLTLNIDDRSVPLAGPMARRILVELEAANRDGEDR